MSQPLYQVNLASVSKRCPEGRSLPKELGPLAKLCGGARRGSLGWFRIAGQDPDDLANGDVSDLLVPFLGLPDGGFVAFWFERAEPAVVWLSSEGESGLVAASFRGFLWLFARGKTALEDLDEREGEAPAIPSAWQVKPKALAAVRARFKRWLSRREHRGDQLPKDEQEEIRKELFRVCRRHGDLKKDWDKEDLVVTLTDRSYRADWYAGGLKPFPGAKELEVPLRRLRQVLGRPIKKADLSVWGDGRVFFEKNTVLEPQAGASGRGRKR